MASEKKGPEVAADVEAQDAQPAVTDEDDVEGHNFAPNAMLSRNAAQTRERDVQRNLQQNDLKKQARRPFFKRG